MGLFKMGIGLYAAYMYADLLKQEISWWWAPLAVLAILLFVDPVVANKLHAYRETLEQHRIKEKQ